MNFIRIFYCCVLLSGSYGVFSQTNCVQHNKAFGYGEELNYQVVYNWGLVWIESAHTTFRTERSQFKGKRTYLLSGKGGTYPKYDWFFKVRDVFVAQLDSVSFRPLKFQADIHEGNKNDKHTYLFNDANHRAFTIINRGDKPVAIDTVKTSPCTIDVLTAIYYARNIDYSKCKPNDTVNVMLLLDGKIYSTYIRYLGKEKYTSKELGTYNCIKFSPRLVEGSIFKKGEEMIVWVTDDDNKVPLYIETPIIVGTIKVRLVSYKGLRNPESSKIAR
ncbi:MAG: DUF3108 domain-containing protein [Bacteroidia bacterium]|nr:DUF3108 domain-containing protein [Bacteroidia bacterium]